MMTTTTTATTTATSTTTTTTTTTTIIIISLNREGRWGTTDDFATSFLYFPLFSTALWDLSNSRPVHSLMLSSHLFLCLPCFLSLPVCLSRWFLPDLMNIS